MADPQFPLWPFRPNWSGNITETLNWQTDVLVSRTGSEQRRLLREFPKKQIEFTTLLTDRERAKQDNYLTGRGAHDWMLPLWWDQHNAEEDLEVGTTFIRCSTATQGEFRQGGWLVLMGRQGAVNEVVQIARIDRVGFALTSPLLKRWGRGSTIYPLQQSRFTEQPQLSRKSDTTVTGSYRFDVTEPDIRTFLPRLLDSTALVTSGLVSRQFSPAADGSIFDPNAGVTVGQANMALAFLRAYDTLSVRPLSASRRAADFYRVNGLSILDAVVDGGLETAAIVRQKLTLDLDTTTLPHWLYAARGSIPDPLLENVNIAAVGEGYELFPEIARPTPGFSSAAPESFRDFDRALSYAIRFDNRSTSLVAQWFNLREKFRRTNLRGRQLDAGQPFVPGVNPFRISGSPEGFSGFRGSPWISAQTPDMWSDLNGRVEDIYGTVSAASLPVKEVGSATVSYPISEVNSYGYQKTTAALLAEQNVSFMRQAQEAYKIEAGFYGPFAETFIFDNADKGIYDGAPIHQWQFKNLYDDRSVFYQLRAVEGLARLIRDTTSKGKKIVQNGVPITVNGKFLFVILAGKDATIGFESSRSWFDVNGEALLIVRRFLSWYDEKWNYTASLVHNGVPVSYNGSRVTVVLQSDENVNANPIGDVPDPSSVGEEIHESSPHSIALLLRSAIWLAQTEDQDFAFYQRIILKSWKYLQYHFTTDGELFGTWYKSAADIKWYYSEIILTLSEMLANASSLPAEINIEDVEYQLTAATVWLEEYGIGQFGSRLIPGFTDKYLGYSVLNVPPNETANIAIDVQRLTSNFDDQISIPILSEYSGDVFNRVQHQWWNAGRSKNNTFRQILYGLRGRATPFWYPTHMRDLELIEPIANNDDSLMVEFVAYTMSGGPRRTREHIAIRLRSGTFIYRRIIRSQDFGDREQLFLNAPIRAAYSLNDIDRISFMDFMRLDQDGVQIGHETDDEGLSTSQTVFRSVKQTAR